MLIAAPIAGLALGLTATSASASTAATPAIYHSYHLFNKLDTSLHTNCTDFGHIYKQVGTASFSPPRDYANVQFYNEWVGDLHFERYYQEGFTTAIIDLGCVNGDWDYMYYGFHMAYRIQYITYNCYSAGCTAAVSYSAWKPGWAVIP
ncbi:MAG TPA: hypothetical protein VHW06_20065 [Streptosporangiaceae bacterium]|jgi:hypothetical protein|nr:hypothetical protein [Streptosporangiaceae bacterium]